MRVALDVGHGLLPDKRYDPGSNGPGVTEHVLASHMAAHVIRNLQQNHISTELIIGPKSLQQRGAHAAGCQAFISLHFNAFDKKTQGTETLICLDPYDEDYELAECVHRNIVDVLRFKDRGIKEQNLAVLKAVPPTIPAILIEPFFIDAMESAEECFDTVQAISPYVGFGIAEFLYRGRHG